VLVKDLGAKGKSKFFFRRSETMKKAKVNLHLDDMIINYTTKETMLMNEFSNLPWRGAREKDPMLMHHIIEGTTEDGDVVFDCIASTGEFRTQ